MIGCWEQWLPGQAESWRWMSWSLKIPEWASDQVTSCPPVIHCKNRQKANTRVILGFDGFQPTWLFTDVQKKILVAFPQTPLKSRQATLQCSMSVNIWSGPKPGRHILTIRHQRLNDVAWHRAASRNIRDVPPCVATRCRLNVGAAQVSAADPAHVSQLLPARSLPWCVPSMNQLTTQYML